jgi:MFS family permease
LARGVDASTSGLLLVPFLAAGPIGAIISGQVVRRLGRTRSMVLIGLSSGLIGFVLLGSFVATSGLVVTELLMAAIGISLGLCMPTSMVIVQNAAERRDVGSATGALLFLRSMGGAFGSTLAGSLLAAGFAARLLAGGVTEHIDLGAVRGQGGAMQHLDPAARAVAAAALAGGFRVAFLACALLVGVALVAATVMRDLPLRSGAK